MKNTYYLLAMYLTIPLNVFACGGTFEYIWYQKIINWLSFAGVALGFLGIIYGLLLYAFQFLGKEKDKKLFSNKKRIIKWSFMILLVSVVIIIVLSAANATLCGSSADF